MAHIFGSLLANGYHVVILGLDSSGKTSVLYRLKLDEYVNTVPTISFNTEKIKCKKGSAKGSTFKFWDAGGAEKLRPLWKSYTRAADAIVYVVDSTEKERFDEAKFELFKVAQRPETKGVPIMLIANKQDLRQAVGVSTIEEALTIPALRKQQHTVNVLAGCALTGEGFEDVLDTLKEIIDKHRKLLKQQKKGR
ncbi:ADP-ribosylation factor-like protein 4C [Strongylocentrotus purpuratus]|uniref:ADP-ribosylation factor-like protein 11 n=1 Tax=Strongylocentrotus purpuratus TaxID=7668 RepID=A0A7M7ND01_STRPU|nr:ADP-ribosylation factor-like protein 4C [Strongylocentrotus purpuratus]XP_030834661.1 ADP-ribosylation factor-like protein 4C [Strongylocentrotus purpuratus]|eukprot:XP_011670619.1 PREDICTED: ADP-ribosylation factor-like protein 4C [Strongylocentrotus purpuratus]